MSTICSPRTRGWTHPDYARHVIAALLPAHAGMDPEVYVPDTELADCSPRTRGWTPAVYA